MTEEHKRKIGLAVSIVRTGKHYPNASVSKKKQWENPEYREKCVKSHIGKSVFISNETRSKISNTLLNRYKDITKTSGWKGGISKAPGYKRAQKAKRMFNTVGSHTKKEWDDLILKTGNICVCCHKNGKEVKLTVDHIIPISKGGSDYIENIQPLCMGCNNRKKTKNINYLKLWQDIFQQQHSDR